MSVLRQKRLLSPVMMGSLLTEDERDIIRTYVETAVE